MGRKGNWFSNVKKALGPESKENKEEKSNKSKKKWFGKQKLQTESDISPSLAPAEEVENEQSEDHVVEESVPEVQASKRKDDVAAAIKIQRAFRRYSGRRALGAKRGLERLKRVMEGAGVKRQAVSTLRAMHALGKAQSQIGSRRMRMLEEKQAALAHKHAKELQSMRVEEEYWDGSVQSKEQVEAKLLSKSEAAMRRERALAYSFSHQKTRKKNSSRSTNLIMFMDPTNPSWGWSWLERWTAHGLIDNKESGLEISKAFAPTQNHPKKAPSPNMEEDGDTKTMPTRFRRHSIAGSIATDDDDHHHGDESLASSPSIPSYMVATKSAKAKSKMMMMMRTQSPSAAVENSTPERGSSRNAKKQLINFPASPARPPRRHSGPPKVETTFNAQVTVGYGVA